MLTLQLHPQRVTQTVNSGLGSTAVKEKSELQHNQWNQNEPYYTPAHGVGTYATMLPMFTIVPDLCFTI